MLSQQPRLATIMAYLYLSLAVWISCSSLRSSESLMLPIQDICFLPLPHLPFIFPSVCITVDYICIWIMYPRYENLGFLTIDYIYFCFPIEWSPSSFFILSVHGMLRIFLYVHFSKAFFLLSISFLIVQNSQPFNRADHM